MTYLQNIQLELVKMNTKVSSQKTNGAWSNRKAKAESRILPRGNVYKRLLSIHSKLWRVV